MALVISNSSSVQKPRISSFRGDCKPWMLKDFLLDDLGSCSSSGFRSFPRRQCCVAVRNLIELEVRGRSSTGSTSRRLFKSSSASSKISNVLQRASLAIIGAVKLLPLKSPVATKMNSNGKKKTLLPRSFSKKLFSKSLWKKKSSEDDRKKGECDIERWISSGAAIAKKYQPLDLSNETTTTTATLTTTTSASTTSSTNSDSWSELDSEFTQPRSSVDENGVVEGKRSSSDKSKKRVTVGDESVESTMTKKKWSNEEEKEQLSPISVLNFPDEDEEIGSSSPFTRRINHLEGTKEKLMQKLRRFECLSRIGKIKLEHQLSHDVEDTNEVSSSPQRTTNIPVINEDEYEKKAIKRLLNIIKVKTMSSNPPKINLDNVLIDFLQEGLAKGRGKSREAVEDTLLIEVENWIRGMNHDEVSMGWKVKEKRKVYVKDMEERGEWRMNRDVEKDEVGVRVGDEIMACLVDEMVGEFSNMELLSLLK